MSVNNFQSAAFFQEKRYLELDLNVKQSSEKKRERGVLLGFFVTSLLATLYLSGAMNFS